MKLTYFMPCLIEAFKVLWVTSLSDLVYCCIVWGRLKRDRWLKEQSPYVAT